MPSKAKGHLKMHNRAASATTNLLAHGNKDSGMSNKFGGTRTKSVEKIKRNASDVQHHVQGRNTQHPTRGDHANMNDNASANAGAGVGGGRRGIVLEVETNSGDDDEWVSSESGAVTPADYDEEDSPPTPRDTTPPGGGISQSQPQQQLQALSQRQGLSQLVIQTQPQAELQFQLQPRPLQPQSQSETQTRIPAASSRLTDPNLGLPSANVHTLSPPALPPIDQQPTARPENPRATTLETEQQSSIDPSSPPSRRARPQSLADLPSVDTVTQFTTGHDWDTYSPSPLSERHQMRTRPPSARSIHNVRPHPLIRTRSYAPATPTVAFSPTTVSPSHISTSPESQVHYSQFLPRLRRQASQSSVNSVATLPVASISNTTAQTSRTNVTATSSIRQRTLSHTSAALLSSLNAHTSSRPNSPVLPVTFPPQPTGDNRPMHSLIPPSLTSQHLMTVVHQNPMLAALIRVKKARAEEGG